MRYEVPGVPAGPALGLSAFLPHFNRAAAGGAQSYKYGVRGGPAQFHYAPTTDTVPSTDVGDLANAGYSRSSDAPDGYWPNDYDVVINDQERPGAGMPIRFYSPTTPGPTTVLPVPAGNPAPGLRRDSARLARTAILQRVRQLPWFPRMFQAPDA